MELSRVLAVLVALALVWMLLAVPSAAADERLAGACPGHVPPAGFADVDPGGVHAEAIDCVAWWEVAAGDGAGHYHPRVAVRRDQLASMLVRLLGQAGQPPEPAQGERFEDLGGNVHADNVEALAAMGVIRGVGGSRFAPGRAVRRDQMASLLVRAHEAVFDELPAGADDFDDTSGNVHEEAIGKLAAAGVTTGTGESTDRYGPAGEVTRAQLASFTMRLLALWIDEGLAAVTDEDDPDAEEGDAASHSPAVSASGRHVAFASQANNLVAQDTGAAAQVYVRDRARGATQLVSVDSEGRAANADAGQPAISGDGRFVAFTSRATHLVPGAAEDAADVFVHDRETGQTSLVSTAAGGRPADGRSDQPAISADGRSVAFLSRAGNLVAGDANGDTDVFVHDRAAGETERVSVAAGGGQTDGPSGPPAISGDGRLVAFASEATSLVAGDTNAEPDVFVRDRAGRITERVSVAGDGQQADGPSRAPSVSPSGDYVAYETAAGNLVDGAEDPDTWHVRRHDRADGTSRVVTEAADGPSYAAAVADDGRVAFVSRATTLTSDWEPNGYEQVFEWDPQRGYFQLSVDDGRGAQANAHARSPSISANGFVVAFMSPATSLVGPSSSGVANVFVHRWVGPLCLAALVSVGPGPEPDPEDDPPSEPPPPDTDDDDQRCEDRSTAPLLRRAEEIHGVLNEKAQELRTTAAVRARDHTGDCVVVFAGGATENLRRAQIEQLQRPHEVDAEPMPDHAEVAALTHIEVLGWEPLALGIAPSQRTICPSCHTFIESTGGEATSTRTAVWP